MSDGGKGSALRPASVSKEQFGNNWDTIFGKKKKILQTSDYTLKSENIVKDKPFATRPFPLFGPFAGLD